MIHEVSCGLAQLKAMRLAGTPGNERRGSAEAILRQARDLPTRSVTAAALVELADAWLGDAPDQAVALTREARSLADAAVAPNLIALSLAIEADAAIAGGDPPTAFDLYQQAIALARMHRRQMYDPVLRATSMRDRIRIFDGAVATALATGREETALELAELARPSLEPDPPPVPIGAVKDALAPDEMVLTYTWLGPRRLLVGVIEPDRCAVEQTLPDPAALASLTELTTFFRDGNAAGWRLSRAQAQGLEGLTPALLPKAAMAALGRRRRVSILPHRALHAVPFGLLPCDGSRLGLLHPIAMIPNLHSLVGTIPVPPGREAVVAAIAYYPDLNPTPQFAEAAADIVAHHRAMHFPIDPLPPAGALSHLAELAKAGRFDTCGLLMLACHGASVQGNEPHRSFVQLGAERLDAGTIEQLRLRADLVLVVACCSGQRAVGGMDMAVWPGDDLFGLQAAFWRAGARQVVGAIWNADVDAAAAMARSVHELWLRGAAASEAVHEGAKRLAQHPYYLHVHEWANFAATRFGRARKEERR